MRIVICTADGEIDWTEAEDYHLDDQNGTLRVITGDENIVCSPHYWQSFVVNPPPDSGTPSNG